MRDNSLFTVSSSAFSSLPPHQHGGERRCEVASADQVPARIQPEGGHEEGQRRGHEKVSDNTHGCRYLS